MSLLLKKIERKKQEHEMIRKTISAKVKIEPLTERGEIQLHIGFNSTHLLTGLVGQGKIQRSKEKLNKKGFLDIVREVEFYHDKEFWNEEELYKSILFKARSMAGITPGIHFNDDYKVEYGRPKIEHSWFTLKSASRFVPEFPADIYEGKDFKITIEEVNIYEYETDDNFSWDDLPVLTKNEK